MTSTTDRELTAEHLRIARRAVEYCYEHGWTDGMPVIPPAEEFVGEFLAHSPRNPDQVLCSAPHLDRHCTVRDAAVNALMAGCRPEYFPVVIAVIEALGEIGPVMAQSTTGRAFAIMINGPIRERLGVNCTQNIFGPGSRANTTIGRALRLVIMNVVDIRPHELDQSTHGTPGKAFLCIGENEEESPWEPLHVERGFAATASTVTVQQGRGTLHVDLRTTQVPEEILYTIAHSMSYLGFTTGSESAGGRIFETEGVLHRDHACIVVMGPEHASHLGREGWSKADARQYLYDHWGNTAEQLRRGGKPAELEGLPDDTFVYAASSPASIKIFVSGANNAGVSTVIPGYVRDAIRPIEG